MFKVYQESVQPMDVKEEHEPSEMNKNILAKEEESVEMKQDIPPKKLEDTLHKFHCNVCNKRFASKISFEKHVSEVHEREKFSVKLLLSRKILTTISSI